MTELVLLQLYYCEYPRCRAILPLSPPNTGYVCAEHKKLREESAIEKMMRIAEELRQSIIEGKVNV